MNNDLPCFIFSFPPDEPITQINDRMARQLGYDRSEIMGTMHFEELFAKGSGIFYKTHFQPMLMLEKKADEIFLSFRAKDGEELPVLMNMEFNEKQGAQYITGVGLLFAKRNNFEKGILEAKRATEQAMEENALLIRTKAQLEKSRTLLEYQLQELGRLNRGQKEFGKILVHDLQEPLRKIQIFASLVQEHANSKGFNARSRGYLERLLQISASGHKLIKRLQGFYELDYDNVDYQKIDLEVLISAAVEKLGIAEIAPDYRQLKVREIYGDPAKLSLLFGELLQNSYANRFPVVQLTITIASDFVQENYHEELKGAYRFMDYVRITFADNAQGFPSYAHDDMFKPLQKLNKGDGSGMGLAYCKKIVELHKGRISIRPVANGGSECIILLPVEDSLVKPNEKIDFSIG